MDTQVTFFDCPAYLDQDGRARCGLPAEVLRRFTMESTGGPLEGVMIKCPAGHHFNAPVEFLALEGAPGARDPRAARLPARQRHR